MKNLLLISRPGVGKTTLVMKVAKKLKDKRLGGFYTEELREEGTRVGFKIKTLDGKEGTLAHCDLRVKYRVGKYGVNIADLDRIAAASVERAIEKSEVIIVDEIGKMELFSKRFQEAVWAALDSKRAVLATIPEFENLFLWRVKDRKDVEVIRITRENRDSLVEEVCKKIGA